MKKDTTTSGKEVHRLLRALRACEERFNNIIPRAADGVLIIDGSGTVRFANPAAGHLFLLDEAELVGHPFGHPVVAGETTEIDLIPRGGAPEIAEMRIVETEWQGEPAFLATLRDITARKQMEQDLQRALAESKASRARINGIIRSIAEGLIVTDADRRLALMNRAAEELLGVRGRAVLGLPIKQVLADAGSDAQALEQLEKGEKFDLEVSSESSRHLRTIQVSRSDILDREGRDTGLVIVLQDVTRAREIERMKSEFVSIAAHELRSPLTSIIGFTELLLGNPDRDPDGQQDLLETIKRQALALAEIINTLLDISRIESGQDIHLKKEKATVADIFSLTAPFIRINAEKIRFQVTPAEESTVLFVDREKIRQVLENLLTNAVKYSPGGGTIRLGGKPVDGNYLFSVADQGIGMTAEQVERVFDKFYRADTSDTAVGGIGLGMNIVRSIIEAHGGKIWVESHVGLGTTVRFTLPTLTAQMSREES